MASVNKNKRFSCLIIILFGLFACQSQENDLKTLLYEPYPNVIFDMNNIHDGNKDVAEAFIAYEKRDYAKAFKLFDALDFETKTPDIYFYIGMSLFADGKYQESVGPIRTGGKYGSQFDDAAKYFLVIADYERGKSEGAFDRLKRMLHQDRMGTFTDRSQQLLQYLSQDDSIPENIEKN